jgi:exopolysaccharide biosynthesis polyprenyl glycosylphosphotransferase
MLKQRAKLFRRLYMLTDYLLVCLAFVVSFELLKLPEVSDIIYRITRIEGLLPIQPYVIHINYILIGALYWVISLRSYGGYDSFRRTSYFQLARQVFKSVFLATLFFGTITYIIKPEVLTQAVILLVFITTLLFLLIERFALLFSLRLIRGRGYNYRQLLIVGTGKRARDFVRLLEANHFWGLRVIGFVDESGGAGTKIDGKEVFGSFDELELILDNRVVDEVFFCLQKKWMDKLEEYIMICERVGVKVHLALDFFDTAIARPKIENVEGIPFLCLESTPSQSFGLFIKRGLDIIISTAFLIILSPLLLLLMMLIKFSSPGPIFFGQERCGLNGRKFTMWKFRTMVPDADQLKLELMNLNEASGPVFKIKDDPRLTPIGKYMRKFSLDELPQLFNVLQGEMSIVGPRPPIPSEVVDYDRWQRRRLSMRPGITCIWQVSGRNKISFDEWVKLDLEYIDEWCLRLDLKIIFKTIPAVLRGTGA